jgi:hypothetical protein
MKIFIIILILVLVYLYFNINLNIDYKEKFTSTNKYVCIFAYYEKNDEYKENLNFFLQNGILDYVDYYIVINGNSTIIIPEKNNIKVIQRENIGFDFGAWSDVLNNYIDKEYDYYIFINSSVRGPYINPNTNKNWLNIFMELFNKPDIKMVGSTINILMENIYNYFDYEPPYTHIQSMFFILTNDAIKFLKDKNFFNDKEINKETDIMAIIIKKEITLSQLLLQNNWNINCIVPVYKNLDYRIIKNNINTSSSDVLFKNAFFGRTLQPEEVIFYKSYRFNV